MTTNENVAVIKKSRTEIRSADIAAVNLSAFAYEARDVASTVVDTLELWDGLNDEAKEVCMKLMLEQAKALRDMADFVHKKANFYHDTAYVSDYLEDNRISHDPFSYV